MKPLTLTTRKVDGHLVVEGRALAMRTFCRPEPAKGLKRRFRVLGWLRGQFWPVSLPPRP
jgi:hypothetical protein